MHKVGYARVSSVGQKLNVQIEKLKATGCTKIFAEKKSGLDQSRPELAKALEYVREGDSFVVCRIDRLARSVSHLSQIVEDLNEQGIAFSVLDQNLDTGTPAGKAMFQMLGIFAEFENSIRRERQQDGIAKAKREDKAKGVNRFGPPIKATPEVKNLVKQLRADQATLAQIEIRTGLSRSTLHRILKAA